MGARMTDHGPRPGWRVAGWLSRWLDEHEREAVLGDLEEMKASPSRACLEIAGLMARRAIGAPRRQILTTVALSGIGVVLGYVAKYWASGAAAQAWFFVDHSVLRDTIWRGGSNTPAGILVAQWAFLNLATLALWAFTAGYLLSTIVGRMRWIAGAAAYAAAIVSGAFAPTLGAAPAVPHVVMWAALTLYVAVAVPIPALAGLQAGRRRLEVPPAMALVVFGIGVALTSRATPALEVAFITSAFGLRPATSWLAVMLAVSMVWPLAMLARGAFPAHSRVGSRLS